MNIGTYGTYSMQTGPQQPQQQNAGAYSAAQASLAESNKRYQATLAGYQQQQQALQGQQAQVAQGYQQRYDTAMSSLEGMGQSSRLDIADQYGQRQAQNVQSMQARGLGGSTLVNANQQGLYREQDRANLSLDEQLRQQRIGYQTQLQGDLLGYQTGAIQQQNQLQQQQLGYMGQYQDPALSYYGAQAQQYGGNQFNYGQSLLNNQWQSMRQDDSQNFQAAQTERARGDFRR